MFASSYKEISESDETQLRHQEREALEKTVELMSAADAKPHDAGMRVQAIHQTFLVWATFLEALVSSDNALSKELKASLISMANFILKHLQAMRTDTSKDFKPVIEPSLSIIKGLS